MNNKVPAVICAAGYGKVHDQARSKLMDPLFGVPVLERVIRNVKQAGMFFPIITVVNPLLGEEIIDQLMEAGHGDVWFAYQSQRRGAANAVYCALPALRQLRAPWFLAMFGEMPNLQPETLVALYRAHLESPETDISFLLTPFESGHTLAPQLGKYAHLRTGWDSGQRQTDYLRIYSEYSACDGDDILGSVYCLRTEWFAQMYHQIPAMYKSDKFGQEYHLPWLVKLAVDGNAKYLPLRLPVHQQVLGINTINDHRLMETVLGGGS
ncbi:MAG TPA: NTP transferase domain-containing protein [Patescibacteria group bacterium]|nr:NTP transferase domain-containing protein [Patescibacteria group bacterium]